MRIGFIGVGGIAKVYLHHLSRLNRPVTAVCDLNEERLTEVARRERASAYGDHQEMLDHEWLDAVFVCIPPGAHTTQVEDAARRRCPVFVAAPVGLDVGAATRTAEALLATGVVNQVGYRSRYSDLCLEAQGMLQDRPLGLGFGRFLCRMSPAHPWWGKRAISGGQLVEQSTHVFDLLRLFLGEVESVHAFGHRGLGDDVADFEDSTVCNLRFASGAVGSLVGTSVARAPTEGHALELTGRDAYLRLQFEQKLTGFIDGDHVDYVGEENGHRRELEQFLRAVEQQRPDTVRCPYTEGVRTLALTVAATRSLETGAIERVPDPFAPPPAPPALAAPHPD